MDISVGAQMSLYTILLVHIYNINDSTAISVFIGFILILILSLISGFINSVVASVLKIIPIITSLFLMFLLLGISAAVFQTWSPYSEAMAFQAGIASETHFAIFREPWMQVLILIITIIIFTYLFNYTKIGKYARAIGANANCATQSGINSTKYKLVAYLVFAVSIAIASFVFVANNGTTTHSSGAGYEMKIMVCLILGGMPLTGGMRSRISSAVVGGFTYALISRSFVFLGYPGQIYYAFCCYNIYCTGFNYQQNLCKNVTQVTISMQESAIKNLYFKSEGGNATNNNYSI